MSLHSVSATHQRFLNQPFILVPPVPKALVSREYGVDIDPNVLTNECHFEIESIAVQQFKTTFDLLLLLD